MKGYQIKATDISISQFAWAKSYTELSYVLKTLYCYL